MKHAFADFYSIRECAKALKLHDDDIEDAAAWLCEQGENTSVKWQIPRISITPICESIISGKWDENQNSGVKKSAPTSYTYTANVKAAAAGSSDTEIHTARSSTLHPSCIEPGKWTMTKKG